MTDKIGQEVRVGDQVVFATELYHTGIVHLGTVERIYWRIYSSNPAIHTDFDDPDDFLLVLKEQAEAARKKNESRLGWLEHKIELFSKSEDELFKDALIDIRNSDSGKLITRQNQYFIKK